MTKTEPAAAERQPAELSAPTKENLELLTNFEDRAHAKISGVQLMIERVSAFFGSPAYFIFAVVFIVVWVLVDTWGRTPAGDTSMRRRFPGCRASSAPTRCC